MTRTMIAEALRAAADIIEHLRDRRDVALPQLVLDTLTFGPMSTSRLAKVLKIDVRKIREALKQLEAMHAVEREPDSKPMTRKLGGQLHTWATGKWRLVKL